MQSPSLCVVVRYYSFNLGMPCVCVFLEEHIDIVVFCKRIFLFTDVISDIL